MKLYITIEDAELKVEKVLETTCEDLADWDRTGSLVEDMATSLQTLKEIKEDEVKVEAERLTQHND